MDQIESTLSSSSSPQSTQPKPFGAFDSMSQYHGVTLGDKTIGDVVLYYYAANKEDYDGRVTAIVSDVIRLDWTMKDLPEKVSHLFPFCSPPPSTALNTTSSPLTPNVCPLQVVIQHPDGTRDRPFRGFATIMSGGCRVLWYGFLTSEESLNELYPHLVRVAARIRGAGVRLVVAYADRCCSYRRLIIKVSLAI